MDNDLAPRGSYVGSVVLSLDGVTKGIIPIFLTVESTISLVPNQPIDYGVDAPGLQTWTSEIKSITITNRRTDASQTVTLELPSYPNGITLNSSAPSITLLPGESGSVDTWFTVDNSLVANGIYNNGNIKFNNADSSLELPTKFIKFYVLNIENISEYANYFFHSIIVHDRNNTRYVIGSGSAKHYELYLNNPGLYDVAIFYFPIY